MIHAFLIKLLFFLYILSAVSISVIYRNRIKKAFGRIGKKTYVMLLIILLLAVVLRLLVLPNCERWDLTEMFAGISKCSYGYNYRGIGFVFMLQAAFAFAEQTYNTIFMLNFVAGCSLVVAAFFFSHILLKDARISLLSGFIFAVSPVFSIISVSDSYTLLAVLFSVITLTFLFMFFRTREFPIFVASLLMMACAVQMRPDNIVFALIFLGACIVYRNCFRDRRTYIFGMIFAAVNIPLITVIYLYFLGIFSVDVTFSGVQLDTDNLVLSILLNSVRLFSENIVKNIGGLFGLNIMLFILPVFAAFGVIYLNRNRKHKELIFLVSYFMLFFIAYSCLHSEGFFNSGLKYIPNILPPLFILSSAGIAFVADRIRRGSLFMPIMVVLLVSVSIYSISVHNAETLNDGSYQEYRYLRENVEMDTSCFIVYTGMPAIPKNAFNFRCDRLININSIDRLEGFIAKKPSGCFYVYSGRYDNAFNNETFKIDSDVFFSRLSEEFDAEEVVNADLEGWNMLMYYFENQ
jgi:hypothetical protein